jgi:hypothetical protein
LFEEEDGMHERTGQIGPLEGFPEEERKHAVELTADQLQQAAGMNRKERRDFAKSIRSHGRTKKRRTR